jgi:hypothetical protein
MPAYSHIRGFGGSPVDIVIGTATFVLVLTIWAILVVLWHMRRAARDRQLRQRLGIELPVDETARVLRLWRGNQQASVVVPSGRSARSVA